ncbi:reverse transcriptase domain-containing protein [Photobacterium damselae]|uniref:reverse transcriptase domain-containing protein n=1 Tax=Photobacterium damselae TaxID=38293 RepID=UPI0040698710
MVNNPFNGWILLLNKQQATSNKQQATSNKQQNYSFICRTDIKGYYANINKMHLLQQLRVYVSDPIVLDLLSQFLHYSVESGGNFHTPKKGIARSSSLSPLLGAFHLYCIDDYFANQPNIYYARYMDDFIILTKTRWHLKRTVSKLNQFFEYFQFTQHPDKTFIGKIAKGFDWMGFWFTDKGCISTAPRALSNHAKKLLWLYERVRKLPVQEQANRIERYLVRWERWQNNIMDSLLRVGDRDWQCSSPLANGGSGH